MMINRHNILLNSHKLVFNEYLDELSLCDYLKFIV